MLLKQDIGRRDLTTNYLLKENKNISAKIAAKEDGIFAGLQEFGLLNTDSKIKPFKNDGDRIRKGDVLIEINGSAKKILERERISLNILQRMSGIATSTNILNKKLRNNAKLAATRKTLWGNIDKRAISVGGGLTHRLNLSDGIIIKDNHLKILKWDFEKALNFTKNKTRYLEIEIENKKDALSVARIIKKLSNNENLFAIMLDKIPPKEVKIIIQDLKNQDLHDYALLEASGNINSENLIEYAGCGADVISMGCITNSANALNMSLEIK